LSAYECAQVHIIRRDSKNTYWLCKYVVRNFKARKVYQFFKIKRLHPSTARYCRYKQYSQSESRLYNLKQCHIPQGLNQQLQDLPFASCSPLTTKHSDWYVQTVAPIIDLLMCLEACCHVTSNDAICIYHFSTFMKLKLTVDRDSEFRQNF